MPTKTGKTSRLHPQAITAGTDLKQRKGNMENQEFHSYDMHLYRDSMQNYKVYQIPKAQLIIADVPYNLGTNAYGSNPSWYVDGDNKNGESDKAGKKFFNSENEFRPAEFMHFCSKMLVKEPKEKVLSTVQPDLFQQLTFDEREKKKQMFMGNAPFGGSNA